MQNNNKQHKFTVTLTSAELKGIKAYLKEVDDEVADKNYIRQYLQGIINGVINAPQESVSSYIERD